MNDTDKINPAPPSGQAKPSARDLTHQVRTALVGLCMHARNSYPDDPGHIVRAFTIEYPAIGNALILARLARLLPATLEAMARAQAGKTSLHEFGQALGALEAAMIESGLFPEFGQVPGLDGATIKDGEDLELNSLFEGEG
jgi:hypothetical protein